MSIDAATVMLREKLINITIRLKAHLEPLAIAANIAQATDTRCDHVLFMLGKLFKVYSELRRKEWQSMPMLNADTKNF